MSPEGSRWRKLTHSVAYHVFRDMKGSEPLAVVDLKIQTNKLGCDLRPPTPGLDRTPIIGFLGLGDFLPESGVNEKAFFQ